MSSFGQSAGNVRAKGSSFCRCCSSASVIAGSLSLRRKRIAWSRYERATAWCFFQCAQPSGRSTPLRVFGIASSFAAPPATWRRRMPCISCRQSWISALNVCALSKTYSPEPPSPSSSPRRTAARNAPTTFFSVAAFSERSSSFRHAATIAPVTVTASAADDDAGGASSASSKASPPTSSYSISRSTWRSRFCFFGGMLRAPSSSAQWTRSRSLSSPHAFAALSTGLRSLHYSPPVYGLMLSRSELPADAVAAEADSLSLRRTCGEGWCGEYVR